MIDKCQLLITCSVFNLVIEYFILFKLITVINHIRRKEKYIFELLALLLAVCCITGLQLILYYSLYLYCQPDDTHGLFVTIYVPIFLNISIVFISYFTYHLYDSIRIKSILDEAESDYETEIETDTPVPNLSPMQPIQPIQVTHVENNTIII